MMYKLIFVDDEEEVRKGIVEKIEWNKHGFEIAGEAENGIEALEIAEKVVPDVIITDIKMPFMDGLTLAEKIREKFPAARIVILTGFDEFEYAQRAIKLDVIEYVLKPISAKELTDVLLKIKAKIDKEMARKKDIETLKDYYKKSLPLLREKFLISLIKSRFDREEIMEKAHTYGIDTSGKLFAVSVMKIDFGSGTEDGPSMYMPEDKELAKVAVFNIVNEVIDKYGSGVAFMHNDYIVIIFSSDSDDRELFMARILSNLEEIRQSIKRYHKFSVTCGVGTIYSDITNVRVSYDNAVTAVDYRLILGRNRIICIEDLEPQCTERIVFDQAKEHSLMSCIKVGTAEEVNETIGNLFKEVINAKAPYKDYQLYLMEILTTILKAARDLNVDMDSLFGDNYNLFNEAFKFNDLEEAQKWFMQTCLKIRGYVSKDRQDTCKLIVDKAIEYLKGNYSDSEITIEKVCGLLHISPTYFSTIFKRETKLTFINYLTQVRMEAAKELLRTTSMKTFEIAKIVGYSEPNYFSYCFKRNFNTSPSEFRRAFQA
jgi:Response regulator containing CheY-like receiver domain and AraC-type DNA-binding domain